MRKILILLILFVSVSINNVSMILKPSDRIVCNKVEKVELNDSTLYSALLYYNIKHPKAVLAQAKLESANYTSYHCRVGNNFLGLYNSRKKEYFKFDHWTECILAYKNKVESKLREGEDYYDFLVRIGYAEDPAYIYKVKRIENNLN